MVQRHLNYYKALFKEDPSFDLLKEVLTKIPDFHIYFHSIVSHM